MTGLFAMKMVIVFASSGRIESILKSLSALGISGMTMSEVKCPREAGINPVSVMNLPDYEPKVKLEIAISDDKVSELSRILSSESIGPEAVADKFYVLDIINSVRIRTGERGDGL